MAAATITNLQHTTTTTTTTEHAKKISLCCKSWERMCEKFSRNFKRKLCLCDDFILSNGERYQDVVGVEYEVR